MKPVIDLSQFNSVTDWALAGRAAGGAIVRVGYRGYGAAGTLVLDPKFRSHMAGALSAGLSAGAYFLSQATSRAEAVQEADFVASLLAGYRIKLPVFCDSEWSNPRRDGRADGLSATARTDFVLAFCERIRSRGYAAGVYASENWFREKLEFTRLSGVCIWCAKYGAVAPTLRHDGWQYTDKGSIAGVRGSVDLSSFASQQAERKLPLGHFSFPLADIERIAYVPMEGAAGETVRDAALRERYGGRNADVMLNAELFNLKNYKPMSGVVAGGKVQLLADTYGVAFAGGKKPALSYRNGGNVDDWLGAYPLLLRDGATAFDKVPAGLAGKRARTALCWNRERCGVCFLTAENGAELSDFAAAIRDLGYLDAVNLDGGGSTAIATPLATYEQGRKVRGKIGIWLRGGEGNRYAQDAGIMQKDASRASGTTLLAHATRPVLNLAPYGEARAILAAGERVRWYGYFCRKLGRKWLYVVTPNRVQGYIRADGMEEV